MPDSCGSYDCKNDAIASMADLHELSGRKQRELKRDGVLYIDDGNTVIEVYACECDEPDVHNCN